MNNLSLEMLFDLFKKNYLYLIIGLLIIIFVSASYFFYTANVKEKIYLSQEAYERA